MGKKLMEMHVNCRVRLINLINMFIHTSGTFFMINYGIYQILASYVN